MPILTYAGIGARATPSSVLADMTVIAGWLARTGWHLATGGAEGADSAFAAGAPADRRSLWLPWPPDPSMRNSRHRSWDHSNDKRTLVIHSLDDGRSSQAARWRSLTP